MLQLRTVAAGVLSFLMTGSVFADDGNKVDTKTYGDYFESNQSGLKGPESFLVITDRAKFDATFGIGVVMGRGVEVLPANAFDSKIVVAAIHRGKSVWTYKVEGASTRDGVLTLRYHAETKEAGGSASFASPLIVAVPKGDCKTVEFIENGKKVATVPIK
jgi:hypothetical protein